MIKLILGIVVLVCLWQAYQLKVLKSDVESAKVTMFIQQGQIYNLKQNRPTVDTPSVKVIKGSELTGFADTAKYIINTISRNN